MGINLKNDYSYLFSSLNQNKNNTNSLAGLTSLLGDYSSIKSGSYGKLMKAYYAEMGSDKVSNKVNNDKPDDAEQNESVSNVVTKADAQKLNKVQTATDDLKESAEALYENGSKSVFNQKNITTKDENGVETTKKDYDTEAIYSAVNQFVKDYNSVLSTAGSADNSTVTSRVDIMMNNTSNNEKALVKVGITIGEDGTLSLDKDAFMKADVSSVKSLFNETNSYGYHVSAQATMINSAAEREASKAATYTADGDYNSFMNTGNLYNSYF